MTSLDTNYERMAKVYDAGRALPIGWLEPWRAVLGRYFPAARSRVLDLGSGTGIFTEAIATWFEIEVVGVEPSGGMRRRAVSHRHPAGVTYVGGRAERIPLRAGSCGGAWLSTVLHHISDLSACARELRRVLDDRGPVLIRNSFADRLDGIQWLDYFPAARRLAATRWPTVERTAKAFGAAGFRIEALESVDEQVARDLRAYYERLRVRANSTLSLIDDEDFTEGLARLKRQAMERPDMGPVMDRRDLLVLR